MRRGSLNGRAKHRPIKLNKLSHKYREARRMLKKRFPSVEETIAMAKKRSNLPDSSWSVVDDAIKRHRRRYSLPGLSDLARKHMRHIMAFSFAITVTVFLVFVPFGRSFASELGRYFAQVLGGNVTFDDLQSKEPPIEVRSSTYLCPSCFSSHTYSTDSTLYSRTFDGMDELAEFYDIPLIFLNDSTAGIESIGVIEPSCSGNGSEFIRVEYGYSDGTRVVISMLTSVTTGFGVIANDDFHETSLLDGSTTLYYSIDRLTGELYGIATHSDSDIPVSIGISDYDALDRVLSRLAVYSSD